MSMSVEHFIRKERKFKQDVAEGKNPKKPTVCTALIGGVLPCTKKVVKNTTLCQGHLNYYNKHG